MTADEIADEIVTVFNELTDQQFTFAAEKPAVVSVVESERDSLGVFVIAKDEQEEAIGDAGWTCRRTRVVSVALNGPITAGDTLGKYLQQCESLRAALEGTEFHGYLWERNAVVSLWDQEALFYRNRFLALFEVTYWNAS